ncbi:MAG: hypothetical protein M1330_02790 [Armatimonadetes bacterium]|nr:hypothetical protein [Armatimonadota bacterium]
MKKRSIGRREFIVSSLAAVASTMTEKASYGAGFAPIAINPARFKQDRFCISFWADPPADAHMDEHYAQIAAANFTVVMGGFGANTPETDRRQLDLCQKHGLKALVYLPGYEDGAAYGSSKIDEIMQADRFPNHPACWGYMLHDEPNSSIFPSLRFMVDHLREKRPGKLGFINLFPTYANEGQLGEPTYEEYVSRFVSEVNPDVLCMDHYPMMQPNQDTRDAYCDNLAVLRKYALAQNIPFWNFFNDMPFDQHYDPTEAQLRWQISTSLAYGAKGVLYFCYWTPTGFQKGGAIIAQDGRPTHHYNQARRINNKLKHWGPTLMQLASEAVYRVPRGSDPAKILNGAPIQLTPGDYLVGVFKHADGRTAVLLNNYSYTYTAWPTVKFATDIENVVEVDPTNGKETSVVDDSPAMAGLQISLGSAEGRLFLIRR